MTTSNVIGASRLLAVCDLLAEPVASLSVDEVGAAAAEQLARLVSCELGAIAIESPHGTYVTSYPRPVSRATYDVLIDRARGASPGRVFDETDLPGWAGDGSRVRAATFEAAGRYRGVVAAQDPIGGGFGATDEWLIMVAARRVAAQLEVVALHEDRLLDRELIADAELAGRMQRSILAEPDSGAGADVAALLRPARLVAGDLYWWASDVHGTTAVVADVSGKGAAAALLMASVHTSIRHAAASGVSAPVELVEAVRTSIESTLERTSRLVTMAAVRVEKVGGLRIASAGHSPVVIRSGSRTELVLPGGAPLGVPGESPQEAWFPFREGDLAVIATDGIIDQRDEAGDAFGTERLVALTAAASGPATDIAAAIAARVADFGRGRPQEDDQAIVVMQPEAS